MIKPGTEHVLLQEQIKYSHVYGQAPTYGHTNHAQGSYWLLEQTIIPGLPDDPQVLDVGCGHGEFLAWIRARLPGPLPLMVYGTDLVAKEIHGAPKDKNGVFFLAGPAWDLGFLDSTVDLLTAFDLLEHIPPAMLPATLQEFDRVCRGEMIFSIGHRSSQKCGIELHQTIQKMPWWRDYLEAAYPGRVQVMKSTHGLASEYFGVKAR